MLAIVYYNLKKVNGADINALCEALGPHYDTVIRMPHLDDESTPVSVVPVPNNKDAGSISVQQGGRAH